MKHKYKIIVQREDGTQREVKALWSIGKAHELKEAHSLDIQEEIGKFLGQEIYATISAWEKELEDNK